MCFDLKGDDESGKTKIIEELVASHDPFTLKWIFYLVFFVNISFLIFQRENLENFGNRTVHSWFIDRKLYLSHLINNLTYIHIRLFYRIFFVLSSRVIRLFNLNILKISSLQHIFWQRLIKPIFNIHLNSFSMWNFFGLMLVYKRLWKTRAKIDFLILLNSS